MRIVKGSSDIPRWPRFDGNQVSLQETTGLARRTRRRLTHATCTSGSPQSLRVSLARASGRPFLREANRLFEHPDDRGGVQVTFSALFECLLEFVIERGNWDRRAVLLAVADGDTEVLIRVSPEETGIKVTLSHPLRVGFEHPCPCGTTADGFNGSCREIPTISATLVFKHARIHDVAGARDDDGVRENVRLVSSSPYTVSRTRLSQSARPGGQTADRRRDGCRTRHRRGCFGTEQLTSQSRARLYNYYSYCQI